MSDTNKDAAIQAEEEIKENTLPEEADAEENAESPVVTDGEVSEGGDEAAQSGVKGKATAAFHKGKAFMTRHGNIWQIVKFTLISLIAFLAEFATMYALQYGLADVCGQDFHWFVFNYDASQGGQATFIAMLGSKCIAEIISFTINRKKTFKANNNVVFSAIMYVITVVALIIFTTWLAGPIGNAMGAHNIDEGLSSTVSKMVGSIISFVVIFLMDKFVIMRNVENGDKEAAADSAEGEAMAAEALAADTADSETVTCDSTDTAEAADSAEENEAVTEISSGDRE